MFDKAQTKGAFYRITPPHTHTPPATPLCSELRSKLSKFGARCDFLICYPSFQVQDHAADDQGNANPRKDDKLLLSATTPPLPPTLGSLSWLKTKQSGATSPLSALTLTTLDHGANQRRRAEESWERPKNLCGTTIRQTDYT